MKPSERISKLCWDKNPPKHPEDMIPFVRAIIEYLDEEWERNHCVQLINDHKHEPTGEKVGDGNICKKEENTY